MIQLIKTVHGGCKIFENDIKDIESHFSIQIPKELKKFYLDYNGADIYLCQFTMDDPSVEPFEVHTIYPIKYCALPYGVTLEKVIEGDRLDGFLLFNLIPFAEDQGGDRYYYDNNTEEVFWIPSDDIDNPEKVCDSVAEFISKLSVCSL